MIAVIIRELGKTALKVVKNPKKVLEILVALAAGIGTSVGWVTERLFNKKPLTAEEGEKLLKVLEAQYNSGAIDEKLYRKLKARIISRMTI